MSGSVRRALSSEAADARAVVEWRKGASDTLTIARSLGMAEPDVCRAIASDQDARHRAREAGKAARR